jgi:hypothetical protein
MRALVRGWLSGEEWASGLLSGVGLLAVALFCKDAAVSAR